MQDFIDRHRSGRFTDAASGADYGHVINRAGWWVGSGDSRFWLFTADGFREAVQGFDTNRAIQALQEYGALAEPAAGQPVSKTEWIGLSSAEQGRQKVRVYRIHEARLFDFAMV